MSMFHRLTWPRIISFNTFEHFQFLRGHPYVENELGEVQESIESSMRAASSSTFTDLFTKPYLLKPLVISLVLMIGQQMCGVNAVIFFSVQV